MDCAASYVNLLTGSAGPLASRVGLACGWLVDTRGAGTKPGLTGGCSVEEITTEVAVVACLVVSGLRPALGVISRDSEKPEKARGSRWHVRRYVVTFLLACV